jgi:4-carboxymuconolactone decarboxylase
VTRPPVSGRSAEASAKATPLERPRLPPLPPRQWTGGARAAIAILSEPASRIGLDPADDTHVHNLVCTQLHHPELMKAYFPFLRYLLQEGVLAPRLRELAILRVAWLRQAEYEWTQHVLIGRRAGLSDEEIARLTGDLDEAGWPPVEAAVVRASDELLRSAQISDRTWETLAGALGVQAVVELIHVIGNYDLIAMFMNSTGLALEEDVEALRFARFAGARGPQGSAA